MPASSSSYTSCQRFGWRAPCTLECASSSTRISCGLRASAASRSNSPSLRPRYSICAGGSTSRPSSSAAVSLRPCVSTTPTTHVDAFFARAGARPAASRRSCRRPPMRRRRSSACRAARSLRFVALDLVARAASSGSGAASLMRRRHRGRRSSHSRFTSRRVEREIELQHVDARLAENAELPAARMRVDQRIARRRATARAPSRRARPDTRRRPG